MEEEMIVLEGIRSNTRCIVCAQILDEENTNCKAPDSYEKLPKSSEKVFASRCDNISWLSTLLTCLTDNSDRERANTNNLELFHGNSTYDPDDQLHVCQTCEKHLVEFDKLSTEVALLNRRLRRLKYTVIAKFASAVGNREDDNINAAENLSLTCSRLETIRKRLRTEFTPNVMLEKLSPWQLVSVQVGSTEWDAVDGDFTSHRSHDSYLSSDVSRVPEAQSSNFHGTDRKVCRSIRKKKRNLKCRQVGPNEFLYAEKFKISFDGVNYSCGLCPSSLSKRDTMVTHIRRIHMRGTEFTTNVMLEKPPPPHLQSVSVSTEWDAVNENVTEHKLDDDYCPSDASCGPETQANNFHFKTNDSSEGNFRRNLKCKQVGPNEFLYAEKFKISFDGVKYSCGLCSSSLSKKNTMVTHIRRIHMHDGMKTYPVKPKSKAEVSVGVTNDFKFAGIPYSYDEVSRKFTCSVCSVSVSHRTSMVTHIGRFHTGRTQQYVCEVCGDLIYGERYYRRHRSRHGPPKYNCQYCGKIFRCERSFKSHVAQHELGEEAKPYQCEYCGKRFIEKKHVNTHVRIHTGEKPYKCDLCDDMFADTAKVFYHKKTVHGIAPKKKFD